MFNVGGGELLVIMLIALIVLGPAKLPEVARQVGSVAKELRRMSSNFQAEMKSALEEPAEAAARERGNKVVSREIAAAPESSEPDMPETEDSDDLAASDADQSAEPEVSTAAAAGMYDIHQGDDSKPSAASNGEAEATQGESAEPAS